VDVNAQGFQRLLPLRRLVDVADLVRRHGLSLQVAREPGEDRAARDLVIRVRAGRFHEMQVLRRAERRVERHERAVDLTDGGDRVQRIAV
jgi:hypothetical protein